MASVSEDLGPSRRFTQLLGDSTLGSPAARHIKELAEPYEHQLVFPRDLPADFEIAPDIEPDSWLMQDKYTKFRTAYQYAAGKAWARPALSRINPEQAYFVWLFIQEGIEGQGEEAKDAT